MSNPTHQSQPPQAAVDQIIGLYNQGQLEETVSLAESLAKQYPMALILYDILGATYMGLKNTDKTIKSYQKALQFNPNHTDAYNNMGMALYDQDKFDAAVESYQKAIELEPDFADAHYNLANALKQKGDLKQAIASYRACISINPNDADVLLNYGNALKDYGEFDQAVEVYAQALKIDPYYAAAQTNMDDAVEEKAEIDNSIKKVLTQNNLIPESAEKLRYMAVWLYDKGNIQKALENLENAIEICPQYAEAYLLMGIVLSENSDSEAAIDSYKKAINIKPDYADAYYNMGNALYEKGDVEAAIDSYKQAINIKPDYAGSFGNMGIILEEKGELDAAIDSYKQAIKIKPDYAEAFMNMGNALQEKGELDAAVDSYKKALKINSSLSFAYKSWRVIVRQKNDLVSETKKDIIKFLDPLLDGLPVGKALWEFSLLADLCNDSNLRTAILEKAMSNNVIYEPKNPKNLTAPPTKKGWKPKVSICCLTYNQQATLGRTLSSFFEQDFEQPFEVIISEDASTDETFDVAARWQKHFPEHIKIIKFKKNVYSAGRNGIEVFYHLAQGDFLAYCEGDDFWLDTKKLKWQVEALEQYPEYNSCTHSFLRLNPFDEGPLPNRPQNAEIGGKLTFEDPFFLQNRGRTFLFPTLVHRNADSSFRLPPECFLCQNTDQVLTCYLGQIGGNIHMNDFVGSAQLVNPFSVWSPLSHEEKQLQRYRSTYAIYQMNRRLGAERAADNMYAILPRYEVPNDQASKFVKDFKIRLPQVKKFAVQDLEFDII